MGWLDTHRAGPAARRPLRAVRHRAVAHLRRHAHRQPRARRLQHPRRVPGRWSLIAGARRCTRCWPCALVVPLMARARLRCCSGSSSTGCSARGILPPLLVTFGLSIIIQNALLETFSADSRRLNAGRHRHREPARSAASSRWAGSRSSRCSSPSLVLVGLQLFIGRTRLGRAFRATADDPDTAALDGHRRPPPLRAGHGAVARHRGRRRRLPRHPHHVRVRQRARPAALRLRGGDHRRPRLAVGHAGRRRHPRRGADASAPALDPAGASSPGTWSSWPSSSSGRRDSSRDSGGSTR